MEFTAEQNINAPATYVFNRVTDIEFFKALARENGVAMTQIEAFTVLRAGCGWHLDGEVRGRQLNHDILVEDYEPEYAFAISTLHKGVKILVAVELEARGSSKCRIYVDLTATATGLTARLALKTASLAKKKMQHRFRRSVRRGAQWLEGEYEAST